MNYAGDGIDRRGFLKCMAWAGTGVVWTLSAGVLSSCGLPQATGPAAGDFTFVQVSDSHIGFSNVPNMDVTGTFQKSIARVTSLQNRPAFVLQQPQIRRKLRRRLRDARQHRQYLAIDLACIGLAGDR